MRFIVIKRKWFFLGIAVLLFASIYFYTDEIIPTFQSSQETDSVLEYHMVTGEFSTTTKEGKKIEAYRFDPGTLIIPKDKDVSLRIFGVNGEEHPFYIEGTDIKGIVKKGEETVIPLHFNEEGTYKLICDIHSHGGKMIAYIIVD